MSDRKLAQKLVDALRQSAQSLGITKRSGRRPLAKKVREALVAADATPRNELRSFATVCQVYEALKYCAAALGITNDPRGSRRDAHADLVREVVGEWEKLVGESWHVVQNEKTGLWDIRDSLNTVICSVQSKYRAEIMARSPEMLQALGEAVLLGSDKIGKSEPGWMVAAQRIRTDLESREPGADDSPSP